MKKISFVPFVILIALMSFAQSSHAEDHILVGVNVKRVILRQDAIMVYFEDHFSRNSTTGGCGKTTVYPGGPKYSGFVIYMQRGSEEYKAFASMVLTAKAIGANIIVYPWSGSCDSAGKFDIFPQWYGIEDKVF